MLCEIWYHLYNLKSVKDIDGGLLFLVKLQIQSVTFLKAAPLPPWAFFTFFKLYTWYQVAQSGSYDYLLMGAIFRRCLHNEH